MDPGLVARLLHPALKQARAALGAACDSGGVACLGHRLLRRQIDMGWLLPGPACAFTLLHRGSLIPLFALAGLWRRRG